MHPVRDPFSYSARWDSVGLTCSSCTHFDAPPTWPDQEFKARCRKHDIPLAILYDASGSGHLADEFFCSAYEDGGRTFPQALEELDGIRHELDDSTLYGAYNDADRRRTLKQFPFNLLPLKPTPNKPEQDDAYQRPC